MAWEIEHQIRLFVGIVHTQTTYIEFADGFRKLVLPEHTKIIYSKNPRIDSARNEIVRSFLESKADHLLFLDSDLVVPPSTAMRLMGSGLDIVGGVYRHRRSPYHLNVYFFCEQDKTFHAIHVLKKVIQFKLGSRDVFGIPLEEARRKSLPY